MIYLYIQLLYIHIWLEDDEEDLVDDSNHISGDDDFVNIYDEEEDIITNAILCSLTINCSALDLYDGEFCCFNNKLSSYQ